MAEKQTRKALDATATSKKPTAAQCRVLTLLDTTPLDSFGMTVYKVRDDMLQRMRDARLVRFQPYGRPPTWVLTPAGRKIARRGTPPAADAKRSHHTRGE